MNEEDEFSQPRPNYSWAELLRKLNALPPPPWNEPKPWRSPPTQDWLQATHHELIQQLVEAHQEIARLKGAVEGQIEEPNDPAPSEEEIQLKLYPPSPLITTPPYEHIVLSERNEARMLLYVNPRLEAGFWTPRLSANNFRMTMAKNTEHVSSSLLVCFDPSTTDTELHNILALNPPITHKILRRRTRADRGSSVPSIDSYYGTDDLHKVGHASYFMPLLTPRERGALGWKSNYIYGKWTYKSSGVLGLGGRSRSSVQSTESTSENQPKKSGTITYQASDLGVPEAHDPTEKTSSASIVDGLRRFFYANKPLRWIAPCIFPKEPEDDGLLPPEDQHGHSHRSLKKQQQQWRASVLGGDIVDWEDSESEVTIIGPHRRPPPILIPVLPGKPNVWFLGTQIPPDHAVLLDELRKRQEHIRHVAFPFPENSEVRGHQQETERKESQASRTNANVNIHPVSHKTSDFRNMNNQIFHSSRHQSSIVH